MIGRVVVVVVVMGEGGLGRRFIMSRWGMGADVGIRREGKWSMRAGGLEASMCLAAETLGQQMGMQVRVQMETLASRADRSLRRPLKRE